MKGYYEDIKEITIIDKDRIGLLAEISYLLGKSHINIETIHLHVVGGKAIIRLGVVQLDAAVDILSKAGFKVLANDRKILVLPNKPGELHKIADMLRMKNIPISNISVLESDGNNTVVSIKALADYTLDGLKY